jgi:LysM repeat protein
MGRHAKPSPAGKLTGQAARVAPALAVTGAVFVPHPKPLPPATAPTVELAVKSVPAKPVPAKPVPAKPVPAKPVPAKPVPAKPVPAKPVSPDRVYIVQAGDTLWSLSQRFYGNGHMWPDIYHANQSQIQDPNEIYIGQELTIPDAGAGTTNAATATVNAAPVKAAPIAGVPSVAAYWIQQAANATGLPVPVVEAQNYVESSYGENMGPSSAGAVGPWQFEPYTWPSYSTAPFSEATNWSVSTNAYIAMMRQLLRWSGGDMRMALAAYNAGQGNWQAGLGYADEILSLAGQG